MSVRNALQGNGFLTGKHWTLSFQSLTPLFEKKHCSHVQFKTLAAAMVSEGSTVVPNGMVSNGWVNPSQNLLLKVGGFFIKFCICFTEWRAEKIYWEFLTRLVTPWCRSIKSWCDCNPESCTCCHESILPYRGSGKILPFNLITTHMDRPCRSCILNERWVTTLP